MAELPQRPPVSELLEFPCDYVFKAFGDTDADGDYAAAVYRAVNSVMPVALDALHSRRSAQGRYLCVSVLIRAEAFSQIEAIYAALRTVEGTKFLL